MATLYELTKEQMDLYEMLSQSINEETGEVDEALVNALNVNREQLEEKCKQYAVVFKQLLADVKMYKDEEERLVEKRKRIEKNAQVLKDKLENVLTQFDIKKLDDPKVSVSFRKSTKVEIVDEEELPVDYVEERITYSPNKTKIMAALKLGYVVNGAKLVESQNIQIR